MSLSLPPSTPPEQVHYCEPAQIRKDDRNNRTGTEIFYVPEQPGRIREPELGYYVDQNALPGPQPPAIPPVQPIQTTWVVPFIKEEDDTPTKVGTTKVDMTKGRLITTMRPRLDIQAPAQAIRHHMNGRYNQVIRAHLPPNRLEL